MAALQAASLDRLLFLAEDRCAAAARVMEGLEAHLLDHFDGAVVAGTACLATARELRTLERAFVVARGHPERIPDLVGQLETLWCGPDPKSLGLCLDGVREAGA